MSSLLINTDDIRDFRDISQNIDQKKVDNAISEAQVLDLRSFLGGPLYLDFISKVFVDSDPMSADYKTLLNGGVYSLDGNDVQFFGVKPMLTRFSYARLIRSLPKNVTRFGVVGKITDQSTPLANTDSANEINDARSSALVYQDDIKLFLNEESSTYPLWNLGSAPNNTKSFEITSAHNVRDNISASYNRNVTG